MHANPSNNLVVVPTIKPTLSSNELTKLEQSFTHRHCNGADVFYAPTMNKQSDMKEVIIKGKIE